MFSSLKKKPHNDRTHDDGVCKMQKIPARCNLAAFESLSQLVIPDIQPGKSKENTPSTWNSYLLTWGSLLHYKLIWSDVKATWLCRASEGNEYVLNTLCCVCVCIHVFALNEFTDRRVHLFYPGRWVFIPPTPPLHVSNAPRFKMMLFRSVSYHSQGKSNAASHPSLLRHKQATSRKEASSISVGGSNGVALVSMFLILIHTY